MSESAQLVKPQTEWTREDKLVQLNIQKGVAGLGIFFSIVLCTNLFLINAWLSNHLTLGFGVVSLILCLGNIAFLVWALNNYQRTQASTEKFTEVTDNKFTRFILFFAIIVLVTFTVYYVIFSFSNTDLINQFEANNQDKRIQEYKDYIGSKIGWINFLSYANIVFLFYTIFCAYAMSGSQTTSRLMIYFIGIFLIFAVFYEYFAVQRLQAITKDADFQPSTWAINVLKSIAISLMVILFFTYLANAKRLRIAYLILGSFFLISCAVQIPATGQLFRDYFKLNEYYSNNCARELGDLDVKYVEELGCPNKYMYKTRRTDCETETANPATCFQPTDDCSKSFLYTAWEKVLVKDPVTNSITACLNKSCCGIAVNVYSRPLLAVAALAFVVIFLSFILAAFCLNLSAKDRGDKTINFGLQALPTVVFLIILIGGIFFISLYAQKTLPKREDVVPRISAQANFKEIYIEKDSTLSHFPNFADHCEVFSTVIKALPNDALGQSVVMSKVWNKDAVTADWATNPHKGLLLKFDPNKVMVKSNRGTNKIDLNNLYARNDAGTADAYAEDGAEDVNTKRPGLIVIVKTPEKSENCIDSTNGNKDINGWFYYHNDEDVYGDSVRLISQDTAALLMNKAADTKFDTTNPQTARFIGFIGQQNAIETILTQKLHVCEWNIACNNYQVNSKVGLDPVVKGSFRIRVIKVDLAKYGFPEVAGKSTHKEEEATAGMIRKNKKTLPVHYEHEIISKYGPKHLQAAPFYTKPTKNVEFQVRVHDFVNDKPISNAHVTYFQLLGDDNKFIDPKNYDYKCDIRKYQDFSTIKYNFQSSFTRTNKNGVSTIQFLFFDPVADYTDATKLSTLQKYTYIIFAERDGYAQNCRVIQFNAVDLQKYGYLDIGLSKFMKEGQARVVLEWNRFADTVASAPEIDIDLHSSFGAPNGQERFMCNVGSQTGNCGGVVYHGDNSQKKIGRSSEAITLEVIGNYDYLFFYNRFVENFQKKIFPQPGQPDLNTKFNEQIFTVQPVIKYFTGYQKKHNNVIRLKDLFADPAADVKFLKDAKTFWYDGTSKFSILPMCIRAGTTNRINLFKFKQGKVDLVANKWLDAKNQCTDATVPKCTAAKAWAVQSLTPVWSDLFADPAVVQTDLQNVNLYGDSQTSSQPNVFTPIFRPSDVTDPKVYRICDVTEIMEDWAYDFTSVGAKLPS